MLCRYSSRIGHLQIVDTLLSAGAIDGEGEQEAWKARRAVQVRHVPRNDEAMNKLQRAGIERAAAGGLAVDVASQLVVASGDVVLDSQAKPLG